MNYEKYATMLKKADPKDFSYERLGLIADKVNSLEEFYQGIDEEIEELSQRNDSFYEEATMLLRSYREDERTIKESITDNLRWEILDAGIELIGLDKSNMHRVDKETERGQKWVNLIKRVNQFIWRIRDFEPEAVLKIRKELMTQPNKIKEITEYLLKEI